MENLEIRIKIDSYMCISGFFPHLDSIIAYLSVEKHGDLNASESLPLEKFIPKDRPDSWVWKASMLFPNRILYRSSLHGVRKYEYECIASAYDMGLLKKIKLSGGYSGPDRAHTLSFPIVWVDELIGWCVGEKKELEELLSNLKFVGKLRRLGMGRVRSVEVSPSDKANEMWELRAMPVKKKGYFPVVTTIRPPYWLRSERRIAWMPEF